MDARRSTERTTKNQPNEKRAKNEKRSWKEVFGVDEEGVGGTGGVIWGFGWH